MKRTPEEGVIDFGDIGTSTPTTIEEMDNRLIAMAYKVIEYRMRNNTASSQETTTFAKRNVEREKLEIEKIRREVALLEAKEKYIKTQEQNQQLFTDAINAMRRYQGNGGMVDGDSDLQDVW